MLLRTFGTLVVEGPPEDPAPTLIVGRRLALLAIIAAAGSRGVTRERLLGLLWPEVEEEQARHTLSQTLYALRRDTRREWVSGTTSLRLHDSVACDLTQFHAAIEAGDLEGAAALATAPFLDGFYLPRAPEFERWAERTREQVHGELRKALETLAKRAHDAHAFDDEAERWRRLADLDPYSVVYASGRLRALVAAGDRATALRVAREYEARLRRDLDADVDPTIRDLIDSLRIFGDPLRAGTLSLPRRQSGDAAGEHTISLGDDGKRGRTEVPQHEGVSLLATTSSPRSPRKLLVAAVGVPLALASLLVFVPRPTPFDRSVGRSPRSGVAREGNGTPNAAASALYAEGMRALFANNALAAARLMSAALERDSSFARAAYFAWLSNRIGGRTDDAARLLPTVRRLAAAAPERDRLFIDASLTNEFAPLPELLAAAEIFAKRYPHDADAQLQLGFALVRAGDWKGSIAAFDSVVKLDSAGGVANAPYCRVCSALHEMSHSYLWWDSTAAAERAARRLLVLRPNEGTGWEALIDPLLRQGRRVEAESAAVRSLAHGASNERADGLLDRDLVRAGRSAELEGRLVVELRSSPPERRGERPWLLSFALRNQGRFADAIQLAESGILPNNVGVIAGHRDDVTDAIAKLEAGEPRSASQKFLAMVDADRAARDTTGYGTRMRSWHMALAATALVAAGDTGRARSLADSLEAISPHSSFGRDPRLHYFVRGLLWQQKGEHAEAVAAFRASLFSLTEGYTRINLALAQSLLALGRATEAIAVLQPALRGGVDGGNSYITHTELHEALAIAFDHAAREVRSLSAGKEREISVANTNSPPRITRLALSDSAEAHWRAVELGWRRADPALRGRYERARARALGRTREN